MIEKLSLVDKEEAVYVVMADDPGDWVACFQKKPDFPARAWAERMVYLHNHGASLPVDETLRPE